MSQTARLLRLPEAAKFLRLSPETVRRYAKQGTVPSIKIGRSRRYDTIALERWIDSLSDLEAREQHAEGGQPEER